MKEPELVVMKNKRNEANESSANHETIVNSRGSMFFGKRLDDIKNFATPVGGFRISWSCWGLFGFSTLARFLIWHNHLSFSPSSEEKSSLID